MDNATFDRLARLLAGGASRRYTLRALIAAALGGATAEELLAAKKDRDKNGNRGNGKDKKDDKDSDRKQERDERDDKSDRVAAQGKNNNNKKKRKKKKKKNNNNGGGNNTGGNSCAGTPLQPGQNFLGCDFSGDNLRGEDLNSSLFKDVDLTDADLCGANLESTSFTDSEADDANFTDVNFDSSSHDNTSYAGANFTNATFRVATFNEVDFSGADFTGADFTGATFSDTDFSGAIFCRTIQPNGNEDNSDCDSCENTCGLCEDCDDEDCLPPDCCSGECVDLDTDFENCGDCGEPCFANQADACEEGECVCGNEPQCSGNQTCCPGEGGDDASCINLNNDTLNCGACGFACLVPTNPCLAVECQNGQCVDVPVDNGSACVVDQQQGQCCASGNTSTCIAGATCCTDSQCNASEACCENQCIDVQDDRENCGACDVICLFPTNPCRGSECDGGQCVESNLPDGTDCEVPSNESGVCCADGGISQCIINATCCTDAQCGEGESCCNGGCINTATNFDRCGSCDNVCLEETASACVGGACVCGDDPPCTGGETCCPGSGGDPAACTNLNDDTLNCGSCGAACIISTNPCLATVCQNGQCQDIPVVNGSACAVDQQGGICCTSGETSNCIVGAECCDSSVCESTEACCENQCIDVQSNFDNCGECDNSCSDSVDQCFHRACVQGECQTLPDEDGEPCVDGICCADSETTICVIDAQCCTDLQCVEGEACCGNTCVDTDNDRDNCGSCEVACLSDATCVAGSCELCEGVVCGNECLPAGSEVCCTVEDCEGKPCQTIVGCSAEHLCEYQNQPNGTPCGLIDEGETCQDGQCVPPVS